MEEALPEEVEQDARAQARVGALLAGKYRLESVLGSGGMATVYAATHRNGKEVALKLLHPELGQNSEIRRRFLREGYVANHVKHTGSVSVLDDDLTDEGWAFLVMERLEGMTVDALWEARVQVNPACVVAVVLPLLDVMRAAHEKEIVHRDLKPANVFLTNAGEVKVLDFGIARMRDATSTMDTTQGEVMGTPSFMAPEQAMGQSKAIDAQTDVWAIGAIGFALLVGEVVHPAENARQAMLFAATRPARPLHELVPSVPEGIAKVFERALAFEKSERWASAKEMRAALIVAACEAYGELPGASVIRAAMGLPPLAETSKEDEVSAVASGRHATLLALAGTNAPRLHDRTKTTGGIATGAIVLPSDIPRARMWMAAVVAGVSFIALSAGVFVHGGRSASAHAEPTAVVAAPAPPPPTPSPAPPAPTDEPASVPLTAAAPPTAPKPSASPSATHAPKAKAPPLAHSAVAAAPSAAKVAPHCQQFVIDPRTGVKRWNLQCL